MFIIKRQRITGIHSGRREVHDFMDQTGCWADRSDAKLFTDRARADRIAREERAKDMSGVLSVVVREVQ